VYDAFGRRASKTINSAMTQFVYDGWNPVQELNGGNPPSPTANLLTGLNIDEYFTRSDSSGTMAFLADALGSTVGLVNSGGAINTNYTYQPFGAATVGGTANASPFQFTGRENDGTGLYFYRARYYSPAFQRFIAQDPLDLKAGDANLYSYVHSQPTVLTDPRGLQDIIPIPEEGPVEIPGGGGEPSGTNVDPPQPPSSCSGGQPDLNQCLGAAGGPESWGDFCRSLPNPAQRASCWSHSYSTPTEQENWCYGQFMT
jgi:RHS repeat-associated protein